MAFLRGAAALALLLVAAGCSQQKQEVPTAPAPSASTEAVVRDVPEATFRTPSGNIECALTQSSVRCDIDDKRWKAPPKPASCQLGWGNGLYISTGNAGVTCAGDTLDGSAKETLEYGRALRAGDVLCSSRSTGVTCTSSQTGHGFVLAASRYALF